MNNIDVATISNFFSTQSLTGFFIKAFSVVFALLYVIYAVISYKQTQEISRTVQNPRNRFILFISLMQIVSGLLLLAFAFLLV